MSVSTIEWREGKVLILDQRKLPIKKVYLECTDYREVAEAIKTLAVRGAPLIGIAAAYGVALGVWHCRSRDREAMRHELAAILQVLEGTRPTAINLSWALRRMAKVADSCSGHSVELLREGLLNEALKIHEEDRRTCAAIGQHGAALLPRGATVLTHCNAGALATGGLGTALAVVYVANQQGKKVKVYADETRPLLQGARLTVWELMEGGVDVTLICDDVAATLLRDRNVDCVIVGADRIASNGDVANKIGTYNLAILAKEHGVPFYVAAPLSTFDFSLEDGKGVPIEERSSEEVANFAGRRTAPRGTKVFCPAFDVTPVRYITGIITEFGVARRPYSKSLMDLRRHT